MNPNKIKKGLECCSKEDTDCINCPYRCGEEILKGTCIMKMSEDTLAYINQRDAEIDMLTINLKFADNTLKGQKKTIDKLSEMLGVCTTAKNDYADQLKRVIDNLKIAKSDAVKEFAVRLLSKAIYIRDEEKANGTIHINDIYETLEEMSGDEHAGD